jgi:EAL domain-containing protein (putative c-di-GMP-specific phosphodiesterase class I)
VAEYVETDLTRQLITKLGVDFAQGHIYGKPVLLESMLSQLADSTQTSAV